MKIPLHLILIYFLCRIHPRPTMSDEVFCGELDKNMDDIRKQLSRQEFHLMTYMWMEERPLTMKEICAWMGKEQEPANSSTTGAQLRELIQKNFVCKTGKRGQKAVYSAVVSRETYYKWELREFQKRWKLSGILRVI